MPANTKYLTQSKSQRFAKVSAAILGSFLVSTTMHLAIAIWCTNIKVFFATYSYTLFVQWSTLMLLTFLYKNGWKCWLLYLSLSAVFCTIYYLGTMYSTINL